MSCFLGACSTLPAILKPHKFGDGVCISGHFRPLLRALTSVRSTVQPPILPGSQYAIVGVRENSKFAS